MLNSLALFLIEDMSRQLDTKMIHLCLIIPSSQCCDLTVGTYVCVYGVMFRMEKNFHSDKIRLHYHSLILPHSSSPEKILCGCVCVHVYTGLTRHVFIRGKAGSLVL